MPHSTILVTLVSLAGPNLWPVVLVLAVLAVGFFVWEQVIYTSEFAVTDRRVIVKVGWIKRRTLETMLEKSKPLASTRDCWAGSSVSGRSRLPGRVGPRRPFIRSPAPLEFRKQVQAAAMAAEERRPVNPAALPPATAPAIREERECPFCAERILVRATLAGFCGRELS